MKYIIALILVVASTAAAAQTNYGPRYPESAPQMDRNQRHCRHLYREREACQDRQCFRQMDRRIRYCMSR